MIALQINGRYLDIRNDDTIVLERTNFRFQDGLREAFTNDFTLPKTPNNVSIFAASGLIDSSSQPFGNLADGVLTIGGDMFTVEVEVVAVREFDMDICVFEKLWPREILERNINDYLVDDDNSISVWNETTQFSLNTDYHAYYAGIANDTDYFQRHPSRCLSDIIEYDVNPQIAPYRITLPNRNHYAIASKKTVCPQNRKQVYECRKGDGGERLYMSGGQHIANDLGFSSDGVDAITFNRKCDVTMTIHYTATRTNLQPRNYWIGCYQNASGHPTVTAGTIMMSFAQNEIYKTGTATLSLQLTQHESPVEVWWTVRGDNGADLSHFALFDIVVDSTITDYAIGDDDYGTELAYVGRTPMTRYLDVFTGDVVEQHYNNLSFNYFGYYCNLPEITIEQLLADLQWVYGMRAVITEDEIRYVPSYATVDLAGNGIIDEISPNSEKLGRNNYILFSGQNKETATPVTTIGNKWLDVDYTLHQFELSYMRQNGNLATLRQYSNPEYDEEANTYSVDFDEIDGFPLAVLSSQYTNVLSPITPFELGFGNIEQSVQADITSDRDVGESDYIILFGHKYMVVSTSYDLRTRQCGITAILTQNSDTNEVNLLNNIKL